MDASTPDLIVFWTVVLVRFLLPLFIPKFPLPAMLVCFALDAVDQSVFQAFTGLDLSGYQGYDKALDIFYLSIAMLTTLRSWTRRPAVQIARALFYIRLVGVSLFELTDWRPVLLLLPNTFEYFFIFYEALRMRGSPNRFSVRFYVKAAVVIWVAIKLPQEYWIHIVRLDFTDALKQFALGAAADAGWSEAVARAPARFAALLVLSAAVLLGVRALIRRVVPPARPGRLAAAPMPSFIDEASERDRHIAERWRVFDLHLLEKIALVGLITLTFARVVPGVDASPLQLAQGVGVIVTFNSFLRLRQARAGRSRESALLAFLVLGLVNVTFVATAERLLRRGDGGLQIPATLFFLLLLTLIVTLYDRWRPVFDTRFGDAGPLAPSA